MKRLFALLLAAMMMLGGVASAEMWEGEKKLVIGTNAEFAPFEMITDSGAISGFDREIMDLIMLILDYEFEYVAMDYEELLPALASGKVDLVISAMEITQERLEQAMFSKPYFSTALKLVVAADGGIGGSADLAGKKVGVRKAGSEFNVADAEILKYERIEEAFEDLAAGKLDAVIVSEEAARIYSECYEELKILDEKMGEETYAIAVALGREELLEEVNVTLSTLNELGFYKSLCAYWFSADD